MNENTKRGKGRPVSETRQKVKELVSLGYTDDIIAEKLGISPETVDYQLKQLYKEAGISKKVGMNRRVYMAVEVSLSRLREAHFLRA